LVPRRQAGAGDVWRAFAAVGEQPGKASLLERLALDLGASLAKALEGLTGRLPGAA
jgi:hypothetical protein